MGAGRQYPRFAAVWIVKPTGFFSDGGNAVIFRDERIQFKIEKNLGKEPNKAEVTITNLAPTTRAAIEKKPLVVRVEAGFNSRDNLEQVFIGDLRKGFTQRDGTDWNTKLLLGDGGRAFSTASVSRSYIPGTKVKAVVNDITDAIGVKLPKGISSALEFEQEFAGGYVAHGPAEQELTSVLAPLGMSWSIQDGQLQVIREVETSADALGRASVQLISEDTGMIGSPAFDDPTKPGQPPILKVAVTLRPAIRCGCAIKVQSRDVNGLFRVEKLTHTGDTRGKDFKTDVEAKAL